MSASLIADEKTIIISAKDVTENKEKDILLFEQSKLASLGDMIGNIAHQWRQPLSTISVIAGTCGIKAEMGDLNLNDIKKLEEDILAQTNYLSDTINTFREFIKDGNAQENIAISKAINKGLNIVKDSLHNNHITITNTEFCEKDANKKDLYISI